MPKRSRSGNNIPSNHGFALGDVITIRDKNGRLLTYRLERGKNGLKKVRVATKQRKAPQNPALRRADLRVGQGGMRNAARQIAARRHFNETEYGTKSARTRDRRQFKKYPAKFSTYMKKDGPKRYDWPGVDDGI